MKTEYLNYQDDKTLLEGYFARPQDKSRSLPLVLVAHAWSGRDAKDTQLGLIYNPIAERRSWQSMKNFFQEIFE